MIEADEVLSDVDDQDTPAAPEISSCPAYPGGEAATRPAVRKQPEGSTAISEEPDKKQVPQALVTISQPMPQCDTNQDDGDSASTISPSETYQISDLVGDIWWRMMGAFGGESGKLFKIEKTFVEVNKDDDEQPERATRTRSEPARNPAWTVFQEQEYQKSLLGNPPPVQELFPETPTHENDGLHPAFHTQDLSKH